MPLKYLNTATIPCNPWYYDIPNYNHAAGRKVQQLHGLIAA
jgi:hypothetical protein